MPKPKKPRSAPQKSTVSGPSTRPAVPERFRGREARRHGCPGRGVPVQPNKPAEFGGRRPSGRRAPRPSRPIPR